MPAFHFPTPNEIVFLAFVFSGKEKTYGKHNKKIDNEDDGINPIHNFRDLLSEGRTPSEEREPIFEEPAKAVPALKSTKVTKSFKKPYLLVL